MSSPPLTILDGSGFGAYEKGGPGSIPLRRGFLDHLPRFNDDALKVYIALIIKSDWISGEVSGDRRQISEDTGLPEWKVKRAVSWLRNGSATHPVYIETVVPPGRSKPPTYRILKHEGERK